MEQESQTPGCPSLTLEIAVKKREEQREFLIPPRL